MAILIVDVANCLGARPDGWWRDRAGATTRLLAAASGLVGTELVMSGMPLVVDRLIAVVEGKAGGVSASAPLEVVRAPGSGDDTIVRVAEETVAGLTGGGPVVVVTADRGLRARLPVGVPFVGPGWFRDAVDALGSAERSSLGSPAPGPRASEGQ